MKEVVKTAALIGFVTAIIFFQPFTEYDDDLESVLFTSSSEDECEDQLSENIDHISSSSSSSSLVDDKPTSVRRKSKRVRHQRETCSKKLTSEISTAEAEKMDVLQSETSWRTRKTKSVLIVASLEFWLLIIVK